MYFGTATDANGDSFDPDTNNIMSYSRWACRNFMSTQQFARIYASYHTTRNYFACPSFNVDAVADFTRDCSDDLLVNFTDNSPGATSWQWDVDGDDVIDYTTQNPSHNYSPGVYDVALTVSNGSQTITKVYVNLIEFETEVISTTQIDLELLTDNWCEETSWTFKDADGNTLYSGGPYQQNVEDNTLFNYTFDVVIGECYSFEILDSYGDGICCSQGNGYYQLTDDNDVIIASGGEIGFGEVTYTSNETLSVNEFEASSIKLYPNPTSNILNVSVEQLNELPDNMKLYNMLGQLVLEKDINNTNDLSIDMSNLNNGMYFLKLQRDAQSISIPVMKK